ncbi:MAG: alpha/beta fold hydrolase, partial [Planctomycetaceae bacterium]|nr:alpha/beta fold hydrolase [Planctomycetaceae bacterium]
MELAMGRLPTPRYSGDFDLKISDDQRIGGTRRITLTVAMEDGDRLPLDLYLPADLADQIDPASLLKPSSALQSRAGILALHPTGAPGKRIIGGDGESKANRGYGLELAQRGYVVICPDYPSFGDYATYDFSNDSFQSGSMKGIVNHMRCVDLLTAIPFVDGNRLGVIGHSLGGHNAMFVGVFDERLKVIVSSCGWTPFHEYYEGRIAGWTSDRYMPRLKDEYGLDPDRVPFDFYEVVAALAPRTFVSVSPLHDSNFEVAGVRKAIPQAQRIYNLLNADASLTLFTPDCAHDFPSDLRVQSYAIMDRVLQHQPTPIEVDYSSELPRIPALEPDDAMKAFSVAPGFQIQRTAAEPLVQDPVAMAFDAAGRLYVAEMRDYSEQADDHLGVIRRLQDDNGDGIFDSSVVFAEGLSWPTAITCYGNGVFVGAAPEILYLTDNDGDGVCDHQQVIFTGFGRGNVQGLLNSFHWGPDNRIYGATSSSAGTISCAVHPERTAIDLRSRDFSFDPVTFDLRPESGGAQHGASFDDYGNRFVCSNSDHAQAIIYRDRYLTRTPGVAVAPPRTSIAVDGGQAEVFRISAVEPWRIVRTRLRMSGLVKGVVGGGGRAAGYFTGSTGITVYRGDAWPESMKGTLIVGDVGSNIVHRKLATADGVSWKATRIDDGFEFVASKDNWFRPVQFANAPDGCLHILDMYRETIEHPASLPPEVKQHLDLTSGRDRGRLYRVAPEGWQARTFESLANLSTRELVETLNHTNGWHRDTASRLLFERQDATAVPLLQSVIRGDKTPAGRPAKPVAVIHALNVLSGLKHLTEADVLAALQHSHPRVREWGVRLAEDKVSSKAIARQLIELAHDDDARVRLQLAFSVADFPPETVAAVLN